MLAIDLTDDVIVVMGGGGAIGSATARVIASAGARVAVADASLDAAQRTAEAIIQAGGAALPLRVDLTQF